MKKSIKIIIAILIMFMLMLATKSYAALECKKGNTKDSKSQEAAFQLEDPSCLFRTELTNLGFRQDLQILYKYHLNTS